MISVSLWMAKRRDNYEPSSAELTTLAVKNIHPKSKVQYKVPELQNSVDDT